MSKKTTAFILTFILTSTGFTKTIPQITTFQTQDMKTMCCVSDGGTQLKRPKPDPKPEPKPEPKP